jgi:ATP-binding cassette subfamily B protein RaxB
MQDDQLFVGTLEDNIIFFDTQYHPNLVRAAATIAGIDDEILAMPMQYNTIVGSLGMALSGGQERVLLARALYRKPHIVFLDEAFDQLDLAREREITERLRRLGVGLVIVSHRPETVRNVDRVIQVGQAPQALLTATG